MEGISSPVPGEISVKKYQKKKVFDDEDGGVDGEDKHLMQAPAHRDSGFDNEYENGSESEESTSSGEEEVGSKELAVVESEIPTKDYLVTIISEKINTDAATDNKFYLTLIGEKGESEKKDVKFEQIEHVKAKKNEKHRLHILTKDVGVLKTVDRACERGQRCVQMVPR